MLGSPRRGLITGVAAALGGSVMLSAAPASAAGFWLYEMGTPDLGTASAGRAALAADAATVFGNPAADQARPLAAAGRHAAGRGQRSLRCDSGTTVPGGNGGNASGIVPGGSLYYAQSVTPDFKLGFWSGSYLGGSLKYEDGWSGRFYNTESDLITLGAGVNAATRSTTGSRSAAVRSRSTASSTRR